MNTRLLRVIAVISLIVLTIPFAIGAAPEKERKIIIFKPGVTDSARSAIVRAHGGDKLQELSLINGQSITLPVGKAAALAAEPEVLRVEEDYYIKAAGKPAKTVSQPPQSLPWGIDRIDAEKAWTSYTGEPVRVAVVDTGIDTTHPDLLPNLKGGVSCVSYTTAYKDDNGHGTHVAGIIGAVDNTIGVVGVGPRIDLYAVKVLDRKGSGYISDIIKGLEWCVSNQIQVINMSLGSPYYSQALGDAVKRVNAAGIVQVAAAGNSSNAVNYPAAYDEVIAVGATDSMNSLAYFSCYGPQVDLVAPGVSIYSTYKGMAYTTLSGTSMAAPHVTGAAALLIDSGKATTPSTVQSVLEAAATDLGQPGKDIYFGSGLVNVYNAVYLNGQL
ncbi:MAG TPA: S8 family peptidase [Bacillota bacterium]|nr:S8 family peptidase [Bacillota bacterium]